MGITGPLGFAEPVLTGSMSASGWFRSRRNHTDPMSWELCDAQTNMAAILKSPQAPLRIEVLFLGLQKLLPPVSPTFLFFLPEASPLTSSLLQNEMPASLPCMHLWSPQHYGSPSTKGFCHPHSELGFGSPPDPPPPPAACRPQATPAGGCCGSFPRLLFSASYTRCTDRSKVSIYIYFSLSHPRTACVSFARLWSCSLSLVKALSQICMFNILSRKRSWLGPWEVV